MSAPAETTPNEDEIARPLAAYLTACGLPPARAGQLARARAEAAAAQGLDRATALARLQADFDQWAVPYGTWFREESNAHRAARGRARILLADLPGRWPEHFLARDLPAEVRSAIGAVPLHATPDLRHTTSMLPQPLDLGPVSDMAEGTWRTFDKWPFLRGVTTWLLFLSLLAVVFYTVRF